MKTWHGISLSDHKMSKPHKNIYKKNYIIAFVYINVKQEYSVNEYVYLQMLFATDQMVLMSMYHTRKSMDVKHT